MKKNHKKNITLKLMMKSHFLYWMEKENTKQKRNDKKIDEKQQAKKYT